MRTTRPSVASLALVLFGFAACLDVSACHETPDAPADRESRLAARLQADTGTAWKVYVDPRAGEVRFLAPISAPARGLSGGSAEEKARALFDRYRDDLGKTDRETIRVRTTTTDAYGNEAVRFDHFLGGTDLPIFDTSSAVEITRDGALVHIEPGFRHDLDAVATSATVTQSAAEATALTQARAVCALLDSDHAVLKQTTLGVFADPGSSPALAWAVDVRTSFEGCAAPRVFVDATTGAVLKMRETSAALTDHVGGVRNRMLGDSKDMKDIDVSASIDLAGTPTWQLVTERHTPTVETYPYEFFQIFNSPISTYTRGSWDPLSVHPGAAVDAHYYATRALDYFQAVHHRNGLDGNGSVLTVVVHDPETNSKGRNAHYNDYGIIFTDDRLDIGDGGGDWLPLSAGFDILAHELAHGVTAHTSALVYETDSGALNEAFSDIMGASAENWLPETRDPAANVLIGERVTRNGLGLRDMSDPSSRGHVDRYRDMPACTAPSGDNDYCHVHSNSGIANRAFTLIVLGGVHKTSHVAVASGIGWERARELFYDSFTKLAPHAN